ncbi:hypothetical protein JKP88DRAFT_228755 [Tribonema minus]|uniref:Uncharacterized protein n=1 Tax=Tribonema minus TaxID=303371 RepID=A0A835YHN8_9STRA|nr:hypothetical protein JKP88DRAFT_228755 [Tribonema minus]
MMKVARMFSDPVVRTRQPLHHHSLHTTNTKKRRWEEEEQQQSNHHCHNDAPHEFAKLAASVKPDPTPSVVADRAPLDSVAPCADAAAPCALDAQAQLVIFDEIAELPPFGVHLTLLRGRLEARLQRPVAAAALTAFLSRYYDLAQWRERYEAAVMLELPDEPVDFALPFDDAEFAELLGGGGGGGARLRQHGSGSGCADVDDVKLNGSVENPPKNLRC